MLIVAAAVLNIYSHIQGEMDVRNIMLYSDNENSIWKPDI